MHFVFDLDGTLCFDYHHIDSLILTILKEAGDYGHQISFASARSYRDCLGLLQGSLAEELVIALNGGVAYDKGQVIFERTVDSSFFHDLMNWCQTYNLPYFVDDSFHYSCHILEKIPFMSSVDPLKLAKQLPLTDLNHPIKAVVYMGEQEELVADLIGELSRQEKADVSYHEREKCLYINPFATNKASTVEALIGQDMIAFGNDKNDIELFKKALYAVQVGDYPPLKAYADEIIPLTTDPSQAVAERIAHLFREFEGR